MSVIVYTVEPINVDIPEIVKYETLILYRTTPELRTPTVHVSVKADIK